MPHFSLFFIHNLSSFFPIKTTSLAPLLFLFHMFPSAPHFLVSTPIVHSCITTLPLHWPVILFLTIHKFLFPSSICLSYAIPSIVPSLIHFWAIPHSPASSLPFRYLFPLCPFPLALQLFPPFSSLLLLSSPPLHSPSCFPLPNFLPFPFSLPLLLNVAANMALATAIKSHFTWTSRAELYQLCCHGDQVHPIHIDCVAMAIHSTVQLFIYWLWTTCPVVHTVMSLRLTT